MALKLEPGMQYLQLCLIFISADHTAKRSFDGGGGHIEVHEEHGKYGGTEKSMDDNGDSQEVCAALEGVKEIAGHCHYAAARYCQPEPHFLSGVEFSCRYGA